jgi:hypothetical protein
MGGEREEGPSDDGASAPVTLESDPARLGREVARARAAERDALAQRDLLLERLEAAELELQRAVEVEAELELAKTELATLRGSMSWRLTAPLRRARRVAAR